MRCFKPDGTDKTHVERLDQVSVAEVPGVHIVAWCENQRVACISCAPVGALSPVRISFYWYICIKEIGI